MKFVKRIKRIKYRWGNMETIIIDISISAPLDLVWLAWVESNRIITWFAPEANVEPRIGGVFELFFWPIKSRTSIYKGMRFHIDRLPEKTSLQLEGTQSIWKTYEWSIFTDISWGNIHWDESHYSS